MVRKLLLLVVLPLLSFSVALAVFLRVSYGGGRPYPDLTAQPLFPEGALERVVTSAEPIGNAAVSADGRIFFTIHPESRPEGAKLLEWKGGVAVPYPSAERQSLFATVLGVAIDGRGRLWTIDAGNHGTGTPRLLAFDLATGALAHDRAFTHDEAPLGSFLQDLQVDAAGETVYIADASFWRRRPALVVYDVATRSARRVLEGHPSVARQHWLIRNPAKDMRFFGGLVDLCVGIDGIALSKDGRSLAYGAMTHDTLYRVPTAALRDPSLAPDALAARVVAIGKKPLNDGLSADLAGNVLLTDVEHGAIVRVAPDGALTTLIRTPLLRWPDSLSYGPDGYLYVADSAIPDQMLQPKSHIRAHAPYFIYRFRPGIDGIPGQ